MTTLKAIQKLFNTMESELGMDARLHTVIVLVTVALEPGLTLTGIQTRTGLPKHMATRVVQLLGEWQKEGVEGYGLLHTEENPTERRQKRVWLTKRGERAIRKFSQS